MISISTALSGIQAATARLDNAANNIANINTSGFRAQEPVQSSSGAGVQVTFSSTAPSLNTQASNVDLPAQVAELSTDKHSVVVALAVIRTQDSITKSLLDILA